MALIGGVQNELLMVAAWSEGGPDITAGKIKLLPYLGNIALRHAVIARLDGKEVGEVGGKPAKIDLSVGKKSLQKINIRISIALDFMDLATKTMCMCGNSGIDW